MALELAKHKYRVSSLQGNLSQNRRQQAMDGFRDGKFDILVATDIAAHGIDVPEVSHVINFDMPDTVDGYTHRIGRTGRALQTGEAFTLAVPSDGSMVREVEKVLNTRIARRRLPGFNYGSSTRKCNSHSSGPISRSVMAAGPAATPVVTLRPPVKERDEREQRPEIPLAGPASPGQRGRAATVQKSHRPAADSPGEFLVITLELLPKNMSHPEFYGGGIRLS